ncbi:MAG: response regulator [Desulfocapsaceae bacterium]|nr:response regulator [Desulfocapsaceae bacterium]
MFGVSAAALLLFSIVSTINQMQAARHATADSMDVLAQVLVSLGNPTFTPLTRESAVGILKNLQVDKDIERGIIFSPDDAVIASYVNPDAAALTFPEVVPWSGPEFFLQNRVLKMNIFHSIVLDGKQVGTLYFLVNLNTLTAQLSASALLLLFSLALILLLVFIVSARLQRLITGPVFLLAETARKITKMGDYGIRVVKNTDDEIGGLIDDFNTMLDVIRQRDAELLEHRHHLEMLVEDRTEQLRQKRDEALAAARAKSEFLANMSHEIRTPMNGIIGVLSLLKDVKLNEEYRGLLHTATQSADSLLLIINDILDFSKIEAGRIEFESIAFDLRDMLEDVALLFVEAAKMKQLDLLCYMPAEIDSRVTGDPTRLRQVLTNLLSNAVKFTLRGEVLLQVSFVTGQADEQLLRFSVEDTGIGIAAEAVKNLFQKFTQADGSTARKYGGTGLGLSVCKQLIELQNGEIGVDSEEGRGSVFWFTLPLRIRAGGSREEHNIDIARGRRFLVVGDNTTSRRIVEAYLRACQAETFVCEGKEAVGSIRKMADEGRPVSTVFIDHRLPDGDGLQSAAAITGEFGPDSPRLILLSPEGGIRKKALAVGVQTIMYKPLRLSQLCAVLSNIPGLTEKAVGREERVAPGVDLQGRILLVDDEPINQKVGVAILKKFGLVTDVAENGCKAVQMVGENFYDLVLMDIQMPEMSGFDATQAIREREAQYGLPRIPIVAMTANAMESTRDHCLSIGMDDFIAKPIKPEILMKRLRPWLGQQLPAAPGQDSAANPPQAPSPQEDAVRAPEPAPVQGLVWNPEKALLLVGGDAVLLQELAGVFLQRSAFLLGNIDRALAAEDAAALHEAAHAYKGALSHFAAEEARELAYTLEKKGREGDLDGAETLLARLNVSVGALVQELQTFVTPE